MDVRGKIDHLHQQLETMMKRGKGNPYVVLDHKRSSRFIQFCPDNNFILCVLDLPKAQMSDSEWKRALKYFEDLKSFPIDSPTGPVLQLRTAKLQFLAMEAFQILENVFELSLAQEDFVVSINESEQEENIEEEPEFKQELVSSIGSNYEALLQHLPEKEQILVGLIFSRFAGFDQARLLCILSDILVQDHLMEHEGDFSVLITNAEEHQLFRHLVSTMDLNNLEPPARLRICLALSYMILNAIPLAIAADQRMQDNHVEKDG